MRQSSLMALIAMTIVSQAVYAEVLPEYAARLPSLSPSCSGRFGIDGKPVSVKVPPGLVSEVNLSADCRNLYVLPPPVQILRLSDVAKAANLGFCPSLKNVHESVANMSSVSKQLSAILNDRVNAHREQQAEIDQNKKKLNEQKLKLAGAREALLSAQKELEQITASEIELLTASAECKASQDSASERCSKTISEQKSLRAKKLQVAARVSSHKEMIVILEGNIESLKGSILSDESGLILQATQLTEIATEMKEIEASVWQQYREYARLEGATGRIVIASNWPRQVDEYRKLNASDFNVVAMPLRSNYVSLVTKKRDANDTSLPAVLSIEIAGLNQVPTGFSGADGVSAEGSTSQQTSSVIASSGNLSGKVVLSLIGACPLEEKNELGTPVSSEVISSYFAPNFIYSYDLIMRGGYRAEAQVDKLIDLISSELIVNGKIESRGIAESNNIFDADVAWKFEYLSVGQPELDMKLEDQNTLEQMVKTSLVDQVLEQVATPQLTQVPSLPNVADPYDPTIQIRHEGESCSSFLGIRYGCHTNVWYTSQKVDAVKERVARLKSRIHAKWVQERTNYFPLTVWGSSAYEGEKQ